MDSAPFFSRFAAPRLLEALEDTPVVLVHGPRQCGKTTLARTVGLPRGYAYVSFDDPLVLASATADPVGFVADLGERTILDEVQRVPFLFAPLKAAVDRDRRPGRLILTGSANVLLVPKLSDSLAGRMEILRLHPLAQCETMGSDPAFLDRVFEGSFRIGSATRVGSGLADRIAAGGFPAALARSTPQRRGTWYRNYLTTLIQRDVRDLARIASLDALPRLLEGAAGQTARLLNITDLAAPLQLTRPTIRDYTTLLENVFLLEELQPWHSNRFSRLIKTPKLQFGDTGLACALLGLDGPNLWKDREALGQLLETFVYQELRRQADWGATPTRFYHFRDKDGIEVDIIADRGAAGLAGIEIKASATVTLKDFRGLKKLKEDTGPRFKAGVVVYDGETCVGFGEDLFAVPVSYLWDPRKG
ncbi:ATP-binding protein [Mesoterricola silvestris]|uniref:AAA family ATPase n=1 Tax=Mesoterricola silvestris TaxID=2927979 RepID=A0AA48GNE2_9BACT|nr:ATP-binding protein [Mesoterricola silvestris]BDU74529.1 hypothetical protein METEAL_37030 [Mesoterricola silvestris]